MKKSITTTPADTREEWQKMAAQAGDSMADMEKNFCDIAYSQLANNCAPLMKPEYRVGFEIVHKNDDATRMAGIFIFRVNQDKYYAPVFFINGTVKGSVLLYRVTQKAFVPASNDWCEYLISVSSAPEGQGSPLSERRTIRTPMNLQDIIEPPIAHGSSLRKYAGFTHQDQTGGDARAWWDSITPARDPEASVLRRFIEEDGGFNALKKIANTAAADFAFAQALFLSCQAEDYMPELSVSEKVASAEPESLLVFHQGLLHNPKVPAYTEAELAQGYKIEDFRKAAQVNEAVFAAASQDLASVTEPGIHEVLLMDGSQHEMLCGYYQRMDLAGKAGRGRNLYDIQETGAPQDMVLVDKTNDFSKRIYTHKNMAMGGVAMGKYIKEITAEVGQAKPEAGKGYRLFNAKSKTFSEPFWVKTIKQSSNGVWEMTCLDSGSLVASAGDTVFLNPDYDDADPGDRVYGKHCVFVPVASKTEKSGRREFESDIPLGDQAALTMMIFDQGFKQATVKKAGAGFVIHTNEEGRYSQELTPTAAKLFLMVKCAMREPLAEETLATARQNRQHTFYYEPLTKLATNLRFDHWPEFLEHVNNDFNVQQIPDSAHVMPVVRDEQFVEPQRVGDRYSSETDETLDTKSPMELYQMSQARGNSALFEHGVVGALTSTYDSMAMVDKWLPKMEEALDCIGRTIFLFYWKPEDFSQAYGTDDQSQLENKLVSNFKAFGELCIELLKKSKQSQQGTPSLT